MKAVLLATKDLSVKPAIFETAYGQAVQVPQMVRINATQTLVAASPTNVLNAAHWASKSLTLS